MPRLHNMPPSPPRAPSPPPVHQPGPASTASSSSSSSAGSVTGGSKMMPLQPTMKPEEPRPLPAPAPESISSQSSPESDGAEPLPPTSGLMSEDSASMPFIGPATREDQQKAKIGFSSIKLGKYRNMKLPGSNLFSRCRIGHSHLTYLYLLKGPLPPECNVVNCQTRTDRHSILLMWDRGLRKCHLFKRRIFLKLSRQMSFLKAAVLYTLLWRPFNHVNGLRCQHSKNRTLGWMFQIWWASFMSGIG